MTRPTLPAGTATRRLAPALALLGLLAACAPRPDDGEQASADGARPQASQAGLVTGGPASGAADDETDSRCGASAAAFRITAASSPAKPSCRNARTLGSRERRFR